MLRSYGLAVFVLCLTFSGCGGDDDGGGASGGSGTGGTAGSAGSAGGGGTGGVAAGGAGGAAGSAGTSGSAGDAGAGGENYYQAISSCGDVPVRDTTCAACVDTACCEAATACGDEPECIALRNCIGLCPDGPDLAACMEGCAEDHAAGLTANSVVGACYRHECVTECSVPAGGTCGVNLADVGCDTCAQQKCCDEAYEFAVTADSWELSDCWAACPVDDVECSGQCIVNHQEGYAKTLVFNSCLLSSCNAQCASEPGTDTCGAVSYADDTCDGCMETECCDEQVQTSSHEDYWLMVACNAACTEGDSDCYTACAEAHLDGSAVRGVSHGCMAINCNAECKQVYDLPPCGGLTMAVGTTDCSPCAETNCCEQLSASGTSYEWHARRSCMALCDQTDADCLSSCTELYPDGLALDIWGTSCFASSCATECEMTPPVCGNTYFADPADACPVCVETSCCTEEQACWSSLECIQNLLCNELCADDDACKADCDTQYATGAALVSTATSCTDTNCGTECAVDGGAP